jgi:hypothetical protein
MNRNAQRTFIGAAATLGVTIVIVLALLFLAGCGSPSSGGKVDQAQYCKDNGWKYEAATDTCKVK